jgi:arabinofuranosyltransferase
MLPAMKTAADEGRNRFGDPGFQVAAAAALIWGVATAWRLRWISDDAFISFRYARNLVEGNGLVFNAGEKVEGFTNLLWTLWCSVGLRLGLEAEAWATLWGIGAYAGVIFLLGWNAIRAGHGSGSAGRVLPVAAVLAAVHPDWNLYATSGLETSAFTFLLLAGFLLATCFRDQDGAFPAAGAVFALAALTRPDGVLPAVVTGAFILGTEYRRFRRPALFAAAFALIWIPVTLWRVGYYGDYFPNTYYAKSAWLPWWEQGGHYILLYFQRYWILLPGLVAIPVLALRNRGGIRNQGILALALTVTYGLYVARVGGDFMYARFLIPVTPFLVLSAELVGSALLRNRAVLLSAVTAAVGAVMVWTPPPVTGTEWKHGVANEPMVYSAERIAGLDHRAEVYRRLFENLPVRVAFFGGDARVVYKARIPVAVESAAGLNDRFIARQEVVERGRVGHEKPAPVLYLVEEKQVHFSLVPLPKQEGGLPVPLMVVEFDERTVGQALYWDPAIMETVRRRGAKVPDFPAYLDRYGEQIDAIPLEKVRKNYLLFRRFYFDHVDDPVREAPFLRRLG